MRFAEPLYLLLLLFIPLPFWFRYKRKGGSIGFSSIKYLKGQRSWSIRARGIIKAFSLIAAVLMIIAIARPQLSVKAEDVPVEGIDICLVIDTSGSMRAGDRLRQVKTVAEEFLKGRKDDRIGLVAFAGKAFMVSPLTRDYEALKWHIESLDFGMVTDGTAIGMAIATAVNLLRDTDREGRIIILLSDGVNNSGEIGPLTAASLARTMGVKVYTIEEGSHLEHFLSGFQGSWEMTDVNLLKEVSSLTGGRYFNIPDMGKLLDVYREIEGIEKKTLKTRRYHYKELFPLLLSSALLLLVSETVLLNTRFRKIP